MNREQIEERLKNLEKERDQLKVNLVGYEGAIIECKYWLDQHKEETA